MNLITIEEFNKYAPEIDLSRYDSPTISGFISMASEKVADYLEYDPIASNVVDETKTARITSEGDLLIFPNKLPVQSLSSLSLIKGTTEIVVSLTDGTNNRYNIDYTRRNIRVAGNNMVVTGYPVIPNFYALRGLQFYTKISYRAGYEPSQLPQIMKLATVLFAKDILSGTTNTTGARRIRQGGIELEYFDKNGESDLVTDAQRLLSQYRRIA